MSPALRIAYRDALRSRGRSVLVLVMIALPVLAVTTADVLIHTSDVNQQEGVDRRLGSAQALVTASSSPQVYQGPDPDGQLSAGGDQRTPMTLAQVEAVIGDRPALEYDAGTARVRTDHGIAYISAIEVDLRSGLASGLARLTSGRWPRADGEVVVNQALADRGVRMGGDLQDADGQTSQVVGIAESTSNRDGEQVVGLPGAFSVREQNGQRSWLVGGAPVTWRQVLALNAEGGIVASRAVLLDPPPADQVPEEVRSYDGGTDSATIAVATLIATMALLEVVLLAGPAFAVSARRHARTLALMAASGGTPRQARRVILASAVVLGGAASVLGVVLGIGLAPLLQPIAQGYSGTWFGPFQVPWLHLIGIAGFGLLSALLAAVVPAFLASRQDVVAVLAGRRGERPPSARSPLLGVVLLGIGVAGSWWGAQNSGGENAIAVSALIAVLGMILVVPVVLAVLARLGARLPLPLRYAVRDAARHRTRTVPAVAAVAATVAGVVALGIGNASDAAQSRAEYQPQLPMGQGVVRTGERQPDWKRVSAAVEAQAPGADVTAVRGTLGSPRGGVSASIDLRVPGDPALLTVWTAALGSGPLVSDGPLPALLGDFSDADRRAAARVLSRGGAVAFADHAVDRSRVRIRVDAYDNRTGESIGRPRRTTVPAVFVHIPRGSARAQGVLSPEAAAAAGLGVGTVGLVVSETTLDTSREQDVQEAIAGIDPDLSVYVERGYQQGDDQRIVLLVLGALGAVLMLGGTLTATFLALADARPDLATLSSVGAAPKTRRGIAAAYAVVVGLVGAVLGAAVGFVPGIAVTYPLTSNSWMGDSAPASHYLDIPWLFIATLVVALPLVTALVVGLTARSRLPLVARLD